MAPLLFQAGGDLQADGKWTLDTPQMLQALEHWGSFFKDGLSVTTQPNGAFPQTFVKGRVGAFYSGPWMITSMEQEGGDGFKDKFTVAPYPKGPAGGTSLVGGSNMVVFKDKPNRDAAWKFLTWLTDPKVQAEWYTTASALPSVEAAWQEPALTADERVQVFGEQLKDAKAAPPVPTWEQVAKVMEAELEKYALGKQDSATTAKRDAGAGRADRHRGLIMATTLERPAVQAKRVARRSGSRANSWVGVDLRAALHRRCSSCSGPVRCWPGSA